ncbi:hypothetical protein ABB37_01553 [Leptomonas pyrrhocoris]|uniref:Uncharacterized protein n=1 Tax=Leptomonas pyrrhocoris TaxID=157538 RepID=A0A0M9G981_LEPPY|nr:hypothetical protein ABB37_01553 [Leptomonas pyrrhocoris]KPA85186.1 hypothetical protein ABB37_01553 [Leptomonas pyrrhocoris]|eukprot:XP_015663625.1 hypothetical protein ABB37_01553 [Leptomonas pyrrhocoris]
MSLSSLSPVSMSVSPIDAAGSAFTPTSPPSRSSASPGLDVAGPPNELRDLRRRTHTLQAELDHYQQLGQRATDAFEEHRRDLTQLAQKERAIRSHREDALRDQLQDALTANKELMTRVAEQRRQHDDAWRAELQRHRDASAQRQAALETLLTQLHTERAELQRSVVGAERTQCVYRDEIDACLEEQKQLQQKVRLLRDGLEGAVEARKADEVNDWTAKEHDGATHEPLSTHCGHRPRQLCCECCDVPPTVWTGPSPTRRVPRRRFVPAGKWDACCLSRASSPATHHVDALVSNIERENYLRPRLYLQRCGREMPPVLATATGPSSPLGDNVDMEKRDAVPYRSALSRPHRSSASQGLSSTTASSASRTCGTNTSSSSSSSISSTSVPTSKHAGEDQRHRSTRRTRSRERAPSSRRVRSPSPQSRGTGLREGFAAHPPRLNDYNRKAQPSSFCMTTSLTARHNAYSGSAINTVCHSLISDLASARAEYQRFQHQLRDPRGDSVEASQQMRGLMRQMDDKINQIRALRREQEKHRDSLRMHDVLQQVMAENRYCEAVYKDLMELIRA